MAEKKEINIKAKYKILVHITGPSLLYINKNMKYYASTMHVTTEM